MSRILPVGAAIVVCLLGCAHALSRPSPEVVADAEGIHVSVVGESCDTHTDPYFVDNDLVEVLLDVEVKNTTQSSLTVRRDRIRLIAPDGVAPRTMTWKAAEPLNVARGETKVVHLRFTNRGSLQCRAPVALDFADALAMAEHNLAVPQLRLVAQ